MIDTFEITLTVAYSIVELLSRELEKEIKFRSSNFCKLPNPLGQPGVRAINITRQKNSDKYSIAIEINPTELLEEAASIELFHCSQENVEALKQALNEALKYVHPYFSLTDRKWRLSRVDYAMQFHTPYVELYTTLESKGPILYRYEGLQKPGSTYKKCKSSRINAYNKGNQLSKTNSSASLKEKATDLYRFEYQCLNPKYLYEKYSIDYSELFGLFRKDIALAVLKAQHKRHVKAGDYYTYYEAAKRINEMKGKQQRTKEQILEVLRFIEAADSLPNALLAIRNDADTVPGRFRGAKSECSYEILKDKFNEFLREHLCKEGINPVLLPDEFAIALLPNTSFKLFTA
ncbi:hypothetical protein BK128_09275 [Viridibacillus sp. FSL H7-0596]|uniref:hypothetical protein n=1 Tax=Viridibacillus sp. FSL H7-0596 TaxID=1928923 RepID=UPI0009700303|nr:hypothetical protein [Viridibacillus sp. FSL H7-0596]OMC86851.1 hypothetical protein BK128_09275 [Viridibacillus sp. FSL H7-0596]